MPSPTARWPRAARSALFAVAAVVLAVVAHGIGDGMLPSWPLAAVAAGVVFVGARAGAARERSFTCIAVVMVGVQAGLHAAFSYLSGASAPTSAVAAALAKIPSGHVWCSVVGAAPLPPAGMSGPGAAAGWLQLTGMTHGGGALGWGMLCGHLGAALVLAWGLRHGEAAVWTMARTTGRVVLRLLQLSQPVAWPALSIRVQRAWSAQSVGGPRCQLLRHSLVLRGPPALAA